MQESNPTLGLLMWAIIIGAILAYIISYRKKVARLKSEYDRALSGYDKRIALQAGRAYYSTLRGKNILTIYDEQAIANDLNAMNDVQNQS